MIASLGVVASFLALAYLVYGLYQQPIATTAFAASKSSASASSPSEIINRSLPVRLKIPKIKVDAQITYVGLTKKGNMATPANVTDIGWYKYGALPGNTGSAVMAGHLDGLKGEPGVFVNLNKLEKGDQISVTDDKQQTASFVVRETRTYDQAEQSSEVFSPHSDGASHLNLITCTGDWDSAQRSFAKRLVVFADKSAN